MKATLMSSCTPARALDSSRYIPFWNTRSRAAGSSNMNSTLKAMKAEGRRTYSHEGYNKGAWILLDYGDVVFHLFHEEARRFYGLERLWGDAPEETQAFTK